MSPELSFSPCIIRNKYFCLFCLALQIYIKARSELHVGTNIYVTGNRQRHNLTALLGEFTVLLEYFDLNFCLDL